MGSCEAIKILKAYNKEIVKLYDSYSQGIDVTTDYISIIKQYNNYLETNETGLKKLMSEYKEVRNTYIDLIGDLDLVYDSAITFNANIEVALSLV